MSLPEGLQLTPFDPEFFRAPYAVYRKLRSGDPCHKESTSFYAGDTWTVTSYHLVQQLLKDHRLSVDSSKIGIPRDPRADNVVTNRPADMMTTDEPHHSRLRSSVQKAFTSSSVARFRTRIAEVFDECTQNLPEQFDVVQMIAKPLPTIVIAEYIGVDSADHVAFKQWTDDLSLQGYPMPTEAQWRMIVAAETKLRNYIEQLINQRQARPADDLISRLIHDAELSHDEIVDMCKLLLGAGNFTTTDLISNAILACLQFGVNASNFDMIVEECLRFDGPSMVVRRFALEDIEVGNQTIARGSVVNLAIAAANHDPAVFPNPETFDPARENPHMAFGRGIHHCLGAPLARLEASITLKCFFEKFPTAKLLDYTRDKRMSFRGCKSLRVMTSVAG